MQISQPTFDRIARSIFVIALLLRIGVFATLNGANFDNHYEQVQFIRARHAIPIASDIDQGFQPPLYYLLAVPFDALGGFKGVQFFALILSILDLVLIWKLFDAQLIPDPFTRLWCLAFSTLLSQFIVYGLYVSNDSLAFTVGLLMALFIVRLIRHPAFLNLLLLALCEAIGLLTKGTFLAYLPVLMVVVYLACTGGRLRRLANGAVFVAVSLLLGSYKFIQCYRYFGRPIVHNLDFNPGWAAAQRPTYIGLSSVFDINVFKLILGPLSDQQTIHTYWLPLYATFWYQQQIVSNFHAALHGWWWIGSATFLFAPVPTLLAIIGGFGLISRRGDMPRDAEHSAISMLSVASIALIFSMLIRYDVQSTPHARLLFPALAGFIILIARGWEMLATAPLLLRRAVGVALGVVIAMNILFLLVEILFHFGLLPSFPIGPPPL